MERESLRKEIDGVIGQLRALEDTCNGGESFVGASAALENGNILLRVNAPAAIYLSRALLEVATNQTEGAHYTFDEINFFDDGETKMTICKGFEAP